VAAIDAFVAEVAIDLEDPRHAADEEPLEIELGRHAEEERNAERVVMGHEGPRGRAAGDRLHHRRLDFEEAARVHEAAHAVDDPRAQRERAQRLRIRVHVDGAAAIADLRIAQAVELLGRRREALRVDLEALRPDADFTLVRAADRAFGDDHVAVVEALRELPRRRVDVALRHRHLEVARVIAQPEEDELPEVAMLHDAAGDQHRRARIGLGGRGRVRQMVLLAELRARGREIDEPVDPMAVRFQAELAAQRRELRATGRDEHGGIDGRFTRGALLRWFAAAHRDSSSRQCRSPRGDPWYRRGLHFAPRRMPRRHA